MKRFLAVLTLLSCPAFFTAAQTPRPVPFPSSPASPTALLPATSSTASVPSQSPGFGASAASLSEVLKRLKFTPAPGQKIPVFDPATLPAVLKERARPALDTAQPPRVSGSGYLLCLPDPPKKPRFPIAEKEWPSRPGDASVCLWEDDKTAAMSLGVDDNCAMNIAGWEAKSKEMGGLNITWFVISGVVGAPGGRLPLYGTWDGFNRLLADGYRVESHTNTHFASYRDDSFIQIWPGIEWEYADSIKQLDSHLTNHKTLTLAYCGGGYSALNDRAVAARYFIGARGTTPSPNPANMTDYMAICASSGPTAEVAKQILDPSPKNKFYRGWYVGFSHFILDFHGPDFDKGKALEFYAQHRADLWTGFFTDVVLYGEERDTATLVTNGATDAEVSFTLTSKMDPSIFNYPLTVKVRLPASWKNCSATQGGKPAVAQVIEHDGVKFGLIKAIPNSGKLTLKPVSGQLRFP